MPGPPVTIGCAVLLSPGAAGPPDSGVILSIPQTAATVGGLPLAVAGSICQMVNSLTGVLYPLPFGQLGSTGATIGGLPLIRPGGLVPHPPGRMQPAAPPAARVLHG